MKDEGKHARRHAWRARSAIAGAVIAGGALVGTAAPAGAIIIIDGRSAVAIVSEGNIGVGAPGGSTAPTGGIIINWRVATDVSIGESDTRTSPEPHLAGAVSLDCACG